eukprot:2377215-Rhodomonas_salina.1
MRGRRSRALGRHAGPRFKNTDHTIRTALGRFEARVRVSCGARRKACGGSGDCRSSRSSNSRCSSRVSSPA